MTNRSQEIHKIVREVVAYQLQERREQVAEIIEGHISAVAEDAKELSLRIADDIITQLVGDAEPSTTAQKAGECT